ncbi:hypothetical protein Q1695_011443 [Nippostrongylus brasiliensis]|nr:hypothetical protein Q1695_011443 [Nippostrongylus brasiliensis]
MKHIVLSNTKSSNLDENDMSAEVFTIKKVECTDQEFRRRLCDTRMDCADGSDESHCPSRPHHDQPTPHTPPSSSRGNTLIVISTNVGMPTSLVTELAFLDDF